MSKHPMFDPKFNPYDELILLNQKMDRLEKVHNLLARDYQITQNELNVALENLRSLQQNQLALSKLINSVVLKESIK